MNTPTVICPICKGRGHNHLGRTHPLHDYKALFQAQSSECGAWDVNNPEDLPEGWLLRQRQPPTFNDHAGVANLTLEVVDPNNPNHYFWILGSVPLERYPTWQKLIEQ